MSGLLVAVLTGVLVVTGLWAIATVLVPVHPRLGDALGVLEGRPRVAPVPAAGGVDRVGSWLRNRFGLGVDERIARQLQLRSISTDRFFTYKIAAAAAGLLLPTLAGALMLLLTGASSIVSVPVGLVLALVGFFAPDIVLSRGRETAASDATESLLTFIDLVTLERLANQSATQALHAAADVCDSAVFAAIRDALQRARFEQRAPFGELKRLADRLDLPALRDIADVMKLDESGAALSGALRARVRELRDAHLTQAKIAAAAVSERMTFFMVVPSLIFGLIFLVPPLLRLVGS